MAGLRSRIDVKMKLVGDGNVHEFFTTFGDTQRVKAKVKSGQVTEAEAIEQFVFAAVQRLGLFEGDFDAWVDAVEDIEISEPPPL